MNNKITFAPSPLQQNRQFFSNYLFNKQNQYVENKVFFDMLSSTVYRELQKNRAYNPSEKDFVNSYFIGLMWRNNSSQVISNSS
ncbi:MAG: hypothetical protein C5B43_05015 [Verrucomicrobia bacterium]|nr:MAG: hypothetical protein C5B43_05015 [Verrucomicrobiota bacterium]